MIQKNIIKQPKAMVEVTVTVPWGDLQPFGIKPYKKWQET